MIGIENVEVIRSILPPRARWLAFEWASLHRDELQEAWERARRLEPPGKIAPLE